MRYACEAQCHREKQGWKSIAQYSSLSPTCPSFLRVKLILKARQGGLWREIGFKKSNLHPERHKGGRRTPRVSACWNVCWKKGQGQLYVCIQMPTMLPVKGSLPVRSQSLRSPEPLSSGRPSWIPLSPDEREACHCFFCQSLKSKQYHSKTLGLKICYK